MIKKRFLILGAIGAIFATNVYADSNKSVVAVYTCQDGCNVTNDAGKTNFSCTNPNGKACGDVIANVFIPQTSDTIVNIAQKTQTKSEPVSGRAGQVSARVAKTTSSLKANGRTPSGPDKAASGDVYIRCPNGCSLECTSVANGQSSICVCKRGNTICDEEVTQIEAPQSF